MEAKKYPNITLITETQVWRIWVLICNKWAITFATTPLNQTQLPTLSQGTSEAYPKSVCYKTGEENRGSPPTFYLRNQNNDKPTSPTLWWPLDHLLLGSQGKKKEPNIKAIKPELYRAPNSTVRCLPLSLFQSVLSIPPFTSFRTFLTGLTIMTGQTCGTLHASIPTSLDSIQMCLYKDC